MWLCNYFVLAEYRWHGVGRALWDSLMEAIATRPEAVGRTQPVRLGLMTTRTSLMRSFYEKFGFRRACEPPGSNKFTSVTPWDATIWQGACAYAESGGNHENITLACFAISKALSTRFAQSLSRSCIIDF